MQDDIDRKEVARLRAAFTRIARSLDRQGPAEGLTRSELWILGTVARKGPIGMGELAEIEGVNPTNLSRMIGKMVNAGLVARLPVANDGRAVRVEVTAAGRAIQDRLRAIRSQWFAEKMAELPADYVEDLLDTLPALEALGDLMVRSTRSRP